MKRYLQSELLKNRKSFVVKLLWVMPIVCFVIAFFLMSGNLMPVLAWNWWYMLFLPFVLAYMCATMLRRDQKKNFHGLFGIVTEKQKLGYGKVIVATFYLVLTNVVFWGVTVIAESILGARIGALNSFMGSIVLSITFAWQIPFLMLLSLKLTCLLV